MISESSIKEIAFGGSTVKVHLFGATVISWQFQGRELLYLSSQAKLDGSKAIRGGIPLVFPSFGLTSIYPQQQHGFARNEWWKLKENSAEGGRRLELQLDWDKNKFGPGGKLNYVVELEERGNLRLQLWAEGVENTKHNLLFHTYFRCKKNIASICIKGLEDCEYEDKIPNSSQYSKVAQSSNKELTGEELAKGIDRRYLNPPTNISLVDDNSHRMGITSNASDVVWNPGKEMTDVPKDEFDKFICIEHGFTCAPLFSSKCLKVEYQPF